MLPSLLPAFSAPSGVKVECSLAASSVVTAAPASGRWKARDKASVNAVVANVRVVFMMVLSLECAFDIEGDVVAVRQRLGVAQDGRAGDRIILQEGTAGAEEAHIADAELPVLVEGGVDADVEVAAVRAAAVEVEHRARTAV